MKVAHRGLGLNASQIQNLQTLEKQAGKEKGKSHFNGLSINHTYDIDNYTKSAQLKPLSKGTLPSVITIDKGTAIASTVHINRSTFDEIVSATTYGKTKWEELGVDDDKRWVVVNGQRFEVPHSPEEKAQRERSKRLSLVELLNQNSTEPTRPKTNGLEKPNGNIEALKNNKPVMNFLSSLFNTTSEADLFSILS